MSHVMTSQQAKLRQLVLGQFQCPFSSSSSSVNSSCVLGDTVGCVFGHQSASTSSFVSECSSTSRPSPPPPAAALLSIPPYICVDHLMNRCVLPTMFDYAKFGLQSCEFGFHPTIEDLASLDRFQCKIACALFTTRRGNSSDTGSGTPESVTNFQTFSTSSSGYLASTSSQAQSEDHQCGVCLEQILGSNRNFGLLEQCTHAFCANCIAEWKERSQGNVLKCPVCRTEIARVIIWPSFITNQAEKKSIMDLQERCSKEEDESADESSDGEDGMETVEEEEDGDGAEAEEEEVLAQATIGRRVRRRRRAQHNPEPARTQLVIDANAIVDLARPLIEMFSNFAIPANGPNQAAGGTARANVVIPNPIAPGTRNSSSGSGGNSGSLDEIDEYD